MEMSPRSSGMTQVTCSCCLREIRIVNLKHGWENSQTNTIERCCLEEKGRLQILRVHLAIFRACV